MKLARASASQRFLAVNQLLLYDCNNNYTGLDEAWARTLVVVNQLIERKSRGKVVVNKVGLQLLQFCNYMYFLNSLMCKYLFNRLKRSNFAVFKYFQKLYVIIYYNL